MPNQRLLTEYGSLMREFGWTLTKLDLGTVLRVSERKIDTMVTSGNCPKFRKLGDAPNSRIVFFAYDVAKWMSD